MTIMGEMIESSTWGRLAPPSAAGQVRIDRDIAVGPIEVRDPAARKALFQEGAEQRSGDHHRQGVYPQRSDAVQELE
jgi:hypothetical protein